MDKKQLQALYFLTALTLVTVFTLLGYLSYLLFKPFQPPLMIQPFQVINEDKTVKKGEKLYFTAEIEKYEEVPSSFNPRIECVDGNLVTITNIEQAPVPVGRHSVTGSQMIPQKTSTGECQLIIAITYHVTKLKNVQVERVTEPFYVIE